MADEVVLESAVRGFCIPRLFARSIADTDRDGWVEMDHRQKERSKGLVWSNIASSFAVYVRSNRPVKLVSRARCWNSISDRNSHAWLEGR